MMIEQNTPEWLAQRCGKVTASRIADLPKNQDAKTLWANHGKSLKEAAAKFDLQQREKL